MERYKIEHTNELEKNYKILGKGLSPYSYTTGVVDEFLEGDYDFLELYGYRFCTGMIRHNGKEIDEEFRISFFMQKNYHFVTAVFFQIIDPDYVNESYFTGVTMTTMKQLVDKPIYYNQETKEDFFGAIIMETVRDHLDDLLDGKSLFLELEKKFCIYAQSSVDRYSYGYGTTHTLYVTHICVAGHKKH